MVAAEGSATTLVSDLYIALFSRFNTYGSWEGHHILDFIHADTQGQSATVLGLAYLVGMSHTQHFRPHGLD